MADLSYFGVLTAFCVIYLRLRCLKNYHNDRCLLSDEVFSAETSNECSMDEEAAEESERRVRPGPCTKS
jgi:hypothetical protein